MRFERVTLSRGGRVVLRDVDFAVRAGELVAVLGPSGAGKSTLLAAATGELAPDAGAIAVLGETLPLPRARLFALRRRVGVLLQGSGLLSDLDVFENVALPLRAHADLPEPLLRRLVAMKLSAVGLRAAQALAPQQLSGGMARRVALARALVLDPPLMLYDEPLTGLDPIARGVIVALIRGLNRTLGLTSLVISHDVAECLAIADRALVVADGRIAFSGTPAELAASRDPALRQFLDGAADGPISFDYATAGARAHA
ncbi:MAG TPA: ATP-binding cassette domain-containing protein [Xanthomonadales bacterium]|nr:ATP-binding cassette domain-containing protein [Xanthomonadales bacterium]